MIKPFNSQINCLAPYSGIRKTRRWMHWRNAASILGFFISFLLFSHLGFSQIQLISSSDGGFENVTQTFGSNGWTVVNDNQNKWYVGTVAVGNGSYGAYIDRYSGSNNQYKKTSDNTSHFYRDITIPSGATNITLSFLLQGSGEIDYDRLLVYTAPTSVSPTAGVPAQWSDNLPGATLVYNQTSFYNSFTTQTVSLPASLAGTTIRLIFTWQNDDNTGTNPPAAVDDISLSYISCVFPTVSSSVTSTCVGAPYGTGTITVNASGGTTPYSYSLNGGAAQSGNTFSALSTGTYSIAVNTASGCSVTTSATISEYPNSADDQNATGTDSWVGHMYSGMNFQNYKGNFTESETFNEGFGGDYNCFSVNSGGSSASVYTEQFSARFKMNSTKKGLYVVDLGSDDGSRLSVDGTMVYNNWTDQPFSSRQRVLINLSGSSNLQYDFYENSGGNSVVFQNLTKVLSNNLSTNINQSICKGNSGVAISGDVFGTLPSGISKSGTGYQWTYSTTPTGTRTNISGATSATYTPNTSTAPFNVPGTYYIYRNAIVSSSNNISPNPYVATNESNAATLTVTALPSATISYPGNPFCKSVSSAQPVTQTGTAGGTFSSSPAGLTINSSTGAITPSNSTAGTYTVTYTMAAAGGCSMQTATTSVTITTLPSATISYSGNPFCKSVSTAQSVTRTGTSGGSYSASPAGLTINPSTGAITPSTSTAGNYIVTYTMAATGGCSVQTVTTSITITAIPFATISYSGNPFCKSVSTDQQVTQTGSVGGTYSASPAGLIINSSTGAITPSTSTAGTYTVTYTMAATGGCSVQTATTSVTINNNPSLSATSPYTCVGSGNTGTITATGSSGSTPYTYSLNGGAYQPSGVFNNLASGTYNVAVKSASGCTATTSVVVSPYPNSTDDPTTSGNNTWIGHIYNGRNFQNYTGYFSEAETFSEEFSGSATCFSVNSSFGTSSIYTENFSVHFNMNSTKKGLYIVDLGSDDGSKLTVDGTLIYNNWTDQSFNTKYRVLLNLTGSSILNYDFYENSGANKVVFQNLTLVLANTLSVNNSQAICQGNAGVAISGDNFGSLPTGISNAGYQWTYSLTPGGSRTNIPGATSASFTPDPSIAPFNSAGTYYVYRNAILKSNNNTGVSNYIASNESNAAIITITAPPSATISYPDAPFCNTLTSSQAVTLTGNNGGSFSGTSGLNINATTGGIIPNGTSIGSYTVTYTIPATGGCSLFSTTTTVYVGSPGAWSGHINTDWNNPGNWLCGQIPSLTTDAIIPQHLNNYPTVITNSAEAKDVIIRPGASLVIDGAIKVSGSVLNSGSFDVSNGTLEMSGASAQNIAGSMFKNRTIKNLVVSNTNASGLSVASTANDTLKITGTLSFGAANSKLNTGNNITLVSNSDGTANVGVVGSGNSINGNVTVERFINTGTASQQHGKSWQFLAIPTSGQNVKQSWMENGNTPSNYGIQITGAGGTAAGFDLYSAAPSMKYYNPSTGNWVGISNTNNQIYDQKGYMVFVRGDRTVTAFNQPANTTTLRTTGTLLTGTLSPIIVTADDFQSIGNPYAAPIDFTMITKDPGIDDKFYVWDPYLYGSYGLGGYQTLSSTNGWKPVPGGTQAYPSGVSTSVIQSGQAFFVHSTQAGGGGSRVTANDQITFSEDAKADASKSINFARKDFRVSDKNSEFLGVSLYTGNGIMADGNTVVFDKNYSNKIDGNDALKITNAGENFGLKRSGKSLSIEARSSAGETDTIFYNMTNMAKKAYQLRFAPDNMQVAGVQAFLLDKFLNTSTPVSLTDSTFVDFAVTSNAASSASDRFNIVFRQMGALPVTFVSIKAIKTDKDIQLVWNVENESEMHQYVVEKSQDGNNFLQSGLVYAKNNRSATYTWTDTNPVNGNNFYRVKSVSKDGKVSYTNIVKVVVEKIAPSISVYPNPITDGSIHVKMINQPAGDYGITLMNSLGQILFSGKINHSENINFETIPAGHLAKGIYQLQIIKPDGKIELIKILN